MTDDRPDTADRTDRELAEPTGPAVSDRYARLLLGDDAVIVYDRTRTDAWIQSDVAVTLPVDGPPRGDDGTPTTTDLPDIRRE